MKKKFNKSMIIVLLLIVLMASSCNFYKPLLNVYQAYPGPGLPLDQIAILIVQPPFLPMKVDGKDGVARRDIFNIVKLLPGPHTISLGYLVDLGGLHYASLETFLSVPFEAEGGYIYIIDYKKGEKAIEVVAKNIGPQKITSPDGKKTIFLKEYVEEVTHKFVYIVEDGIERKEYPLFEFPDNYPTFSPNGKRIAFRSKVGLIWTMVVDGVEQQYDNLWFYGFSPDGKNYLYWARLDEKEFVVFNGKEGIKYDKVRTESIVFSPDGKNYLYWARLDEKEFVVFNGKEGKRYNKVRWYSIVFSPARTKMAYIVDSGGKSFVVVNGKEGKKYDAVSSGLFFSMLEPRMANLDDEQKRMIRNDQVTSYSIVFSPDSTKIAYIAHSGGKSFVVANGKEGKHYDDINLESLEFSLDSKTIYYSAKEGKKWVSIKEAI